MLCSPISDQLRVQERHIPARMAFMSRGVSKHLRAKRCRTELVAVLGPPDRLEPLTIMKAASVRTTAAPSGRRQGTMSGWMRLRRRSSRSP